MGSRSFISGSLLSAGLCAASPSAAAGAEAAPLYQNRLAPVEARVDDLLGRLTLDEKISLTTGDRDFYIRPVPRLGLPEIKMSDGPLGARNDGPSTAYPATVALAASWDTDLARAFGEAMGRDSRARGVHILLAPGVNIQRVPNNGRNFEYFSEDPLLAARMGVGVIRGIQSQGVVATVKHFAANNQETERFSIDTIVGERALRELYLPAFRAAVKEAGVWAVMDAYNQVNGEYSSANDWLNKKILKGEWDFQGLLMSDWSGTHDTLAAANGGLDLEMPGGSFFTPELVKPLLASGKITLATLNDKVRRILRLEIANGFLDRPQLDASLPKDDPKNAETALKIAREGITLLKNNGGLLPLDRSAVKTIVVAGPAADSYPSAGGSSRVQPFHYISLVDGLRAAAGPGTKIEFIPALGAVPITRLLAASRYAGPLKTEFFNGTALQGPPVLTQDAAGIDNDWTGKAPAPGLGENKYSVRWTGAIEAPENGEYTFIVQSDDGARVFLDGKPILDIWGPHALITKETALTLAKGVRHDLRVEYFQDMGDAVVRFGWGKIPPPAAMAEDVKKKLRAADAVIIGAGYTMADECEGFDRTYALPEGQAEFIAAAAELNPRTIVALNSGGRVETASWLPSVPAFLQAWYPGQEGGRALAEIIFGDVNPGAKLPFSYEKRQEDNASWGNYPGGHNRVEYKEGIFVGYRWLDDRKIEPLFPFGYGLSYTTFKYDDLRVTRGDDGVYTADFSLTNSGARAGAEIAQLYVEPPAGTVPRPVRELKGFARVALAPGESRRVFIPLDSGAFAYFSEEDGAWKTGPGSYGIAVGASSRDLRARAAVEVN